MSKALWIAFGILCCVVSISCYAFAPEMVQEGDLKDLSFNDTDLELGSSCGGNCPSQTCSTCPCGSSRRDLDIATWCAKYSGWSQACCKCIVSHESGGNANAVNQNTGGSLDVGLWQINSMNWASCSGGHAPCDPSTNLNCAVKVYGWGGHSFKLWSTCGACGCC